MTDATPPEAAAPAPEDATAPAAARPAGKRANTPAKPGATSATAQNRPARKLHPMLDQLAALHPPLFGARFVPLKLGIFEDLLARHGELLARDALKIALGQHARSTRYLDCVAAGLPRHDLDGRPVEPVTPEHRHLAILEVFRRRQGAPSASRADPRERARARLIESIEASALTRAEYMERMPTKDETCAALIDEAFMELGRQDAKREALLRAFEASGRSEAEFAEMYGLAPQEAQATLERARRRRAAPPAAATAVGDTD